MPDISTVRKVTNAQFLDAVSKLAPEFGKLTSKTGRDVFNEAGFQALQSIPRTGQGDNVTRFYNVALLVGLQFVDFVSGKDILDRYGIIERFNMDLGSYMQRNQVARIPNVNPGWLGFDGNGLQNGDSVDPWKVRKPVVYQQYYGLNWNYQNFVSLQDFDLKRGWLTEGGIGDIVAQIYNMIALDRKEQEFALFFKVFAGALGSETYPLQETQQIELDSWGSGTGGTVTDDDINGMIIDVKNVAEALDTTPSVSAFNAMGYPNDASVDDHVLFVRQGLKSQFEKVFGYAYNDERLQFPFKIVSVPNFGGLIPYTLDQSENKVVMQEVWSELGVTVGYLPKDGVTINGYATQRASDGEWIVNVTSGGATADTTITHPEDVSFEDPYEDILAVLMQKGTIFELIQNPFTTEPIYNPRGMYTNTFFNQPDNGINYNHGRNVVTFSKPAADASSSDDDASESDPI